VVRGNHGEHWLNGQKVVEFDLGTARMDSLLAASKVTRRFPDSVRSAAATSSCKTTETRSNFRDIKVRPL